MASIYKRPSRSCWYVAYELNGRRMVKSLKTSDPKRAQFLKKEIEVKLKKGVQEESKVKSIQGFVDEYFQIKNHRKKHTNINERYTIEDFLEKIQKKTVNGFIESDIVAFMEKYDQTRACVTYNNVLAVVKRFFKLAVDKGYILKSPCQNMSFKKVPAPLPHFFTHNEYLKIEKAAENHPLFPMIVTARYTGLRLRELIHLEWEDFDWKRKLLRVLNKPGLGHTIKNYQAREVPISNELRIKLLPYIRKRGTCFPSPAGENGTKFYAVYGPKFALRGILKRAGIDRNRRMGWHEFRHTFASHLVQKNVPIYKISKWLGHSNLVITQVYAHFAPVYDRDIEKLAISH